jgi:hypothetical protein
MWRTWLLDDTPQESELGFIYSCRERPLGLRLSGFCNFRRGIAISESDTCETSMDGLLMLRARLCRWRQPRTIHSRKCNIHSILPFSVRIATYNSAV